jgi:hypothetical protein
METCWVTNSHSDSPSAAFPDGQREMFPLSGANSALCVSFHFYEALQVRRRAVLISISEIY